MCFDLTFGMWLHVQVDVGGRTRKNFLSGDLYAEECGMEG